MGTTPHPSLLWVPFLAMALCLVLCMPVYFLWCLKINKHSIPMPKSRQSQLSVADTRESVAEAMVKADWQHRAHSINLQLWIVTWDETGGGAAAPQDAGTRCLDAFPFSFSCSFPRNGRTHELLDNNNNDDALVPAQNVFCGAY